MNRRIDKPALIFGVLYLAVAVWWLIQRNLSLPTLPNSGWVIAGLLIASGVIGIGSAVRSADRARRRGSRDDDSW